MPNNRANAPYPQEIPGTAPAISGSHLQLALSLRQERSRGRLTVVAYKHDDTVREPYDGERCACTNQSFLPCRQCVELG